MRQVLLRMVCDECGYVEVFEIHNSEPLTATMNPGEVTKKRGWSSRPKENSRFSTYDVCESCVRHKQPKKTR